MASRAALRRERMAKAVLAANGQEGIFIQGPVATRRHQHWPGQLLRDNARRAIPVGAEPVRVRVSKPMLPI